MTRRLLLLAPLMAAALSTPPALAQERQGQSVEAAPAPLSCPALLNKTFPRLQDDAPQNLCQYSGKVLLIVNTASYCGFTPQYKGLEALYAKYRDQGLVVLGFPSNDFGKQEPGSSKEIADFCYNTYGVQFPMFAKSSVKGKQANPLHAELATLTGHQPKWNFTKYLIDRNGKIADYYGSRVKPDDKELVARMEALLREPAPKN